MRNGVLRKMAMYSKPYLILLCLVLSGGAMDNEIVYAQTCECSVGADGVLVREGPGRSYNAIHTLKKNTKVTITSMSSTVERTNNVTGTWLKIAGEKGVEGWVFGPYIICKENKKTGFPEYLSRTHFPFDVEGKSFNLSMYCSGDTGSGLTTNIQFKKNNDAVLHTNTGLTVPSCDIIKTGKYEVKGDAITITWNQITIAKEYHDQHEFDETTVSKSKVVEKFYMVTCVSEKIGEEYFSTLNDCFGLFNNEYRMNEAEILVLETNNSNGTPPHLTRHGRFVRHGDGK